MRKAVTAERGLYEEYSKRTGAAGAECDELNRTILNRMEEYGHCDDIEAAGKMAAGLLALKKEEYASANSNF